jgi:hypothetical membrane protein
MSAALGVLAAVATLACITFLVVAHLRPTGYDPVRDPVSDYGVGRYQGLYAGATATIGIAALALAVGLWREDAPWHVLALLVLFALARFAIPVFPTDLEGERRSRPGEIHLLLAAVAFASICWAMSAYRAAPWLGYVAAVCAVGTLLSLRGLHVLRPWTGLIERGFYVAMLTWFLLVSVELVS